jgi:hypothetical protein
MTPELEALYGADVQEYHDSRRAYDDDEMRLEKEFKADLEKFYGVTDNPKADLLWNKAYELWHSPDHSELAVYYGNLVELIN